MALRVVLDANVLYPFWLRDTLLRMAERGLIQIYWSERILDEAIRNLVDDLRIRSEQGERLRSAMVRAFPEAMVSGYESLIPSMLNAEKDRHVSAVAVCCVAHRIVTFNLRDFGDLPEGIEACRRASSRPLPAGGSPPGRGRAPELSRQVARDRIRRLRYAIDPGGWG